MSNFELAADAIVSGDTDTLTRLLDANPELIHERSTREHGCTLLHYVGANGFEGFRQKSPKNAYFNHDGVSDPVVESRLHPKGARYSTIHSVPLV